MKRREAIKSLATGAAAGIASAVSGGIAASADEQTTKPKRSARIAHLTDCHVYPGRRAAEGLAKAIRHVHNLDDSPDFLLTAATRSTTLWKKISFRSKPNGPSGRPPGKTTARCPSGT